MPSEESNSEIIIDKRGDVRLRVGTDQDGQSQVTFLACSRALARSSPVLDRMLYGNFLESKANCETATGCDEWTVDLPEDKPQPMRVLMHLSHAQFHEIRGALSIDDIYELTALTHYYDNTRLVVPWMGKLMPSIEDILASPAKSSDLSIPKMMWVSWELGLKDAFIDLAHKLMMESRGPWSAEDIRKQVQTPPGILGESIVESRLFYSVDEIRNMIDLLVVRAYRA